MLQALYAYKTQYEKELLMAQAKISVVEEMIANEVKKQAENVEEPASDVSGQMQITEDESY